MKDETQAAIRKTKSGKARGPINLSVEVLEALEDYEIDEITTLPDEIYDTKFRFHQTSSKLYL